MSGMSSRMNVGLALSPLSPLNPNQLWEQPAFAAEVDKEISKREAEFERIRLEFRRLKSVAASVNPVLTLTGGGLRLKEHMAAKAKAKAQETLERPSSEDNSKPQEEQEHDFVVKQLEVMAREKARLAEENARLWREYNSLCDIVTVGMSLEEDDEQCCDETHEAEAEAKASP